MCYYRYAVDGLCEVKSAKQQNKSAEIGQCNDAEISGETARIGLRSLTQIVGAMVRLENGDWIFQPD
jgi:hypothetical protein